MQQTVTPIELDIDAELFTKRERHLIRRLREHRTVDAEIAVQARLMRGVGLIHEPRVTSAPPVRDYMTYLCHVGVDLSDGEREIVSVVKRYVSQSDLADYDEKTGRVRLKYASAERVAKVLQHRFSDNAEEDARLQDAYMVLSERTGQSEPELTSTERMASLRLEERERAAEQHKILTERKEIVQSALDLMRQYHPEWYLILWNRYVMDEHWEKVKRLAGRDGAELTDKEYRNARGKALRKFDRWARGLT